MSNVLETAKNSLSLHVFLLFCFALILNQEGPRVPSGNEYTYLLYLQKAHHPQLLSTDWTFQETTAGHPIFNFVFGFPTRLFSLEVVGWVGRFISWILTFVALLRIGRHFKIPMWVVSGTILIWLVERQSFVSVEWIIGSFEAKSIAYICLLFAIDAILNRRLILPAMLTGLAFTFHSEVGLWGGAAIGLAYATTHPLRKSFIYAGITVLFALPGLISILPLAMAQRSLTMDDARFMVTAELPFHLDPKTYGVAKIGLLFVMLAFNFLHVRANAEDQDLKYLFRFQLFAAMFFVAGIVLRATGQFSFLIGFPFRVFAAVIFLFFLWHLSAAIVHYKDTKPSPVLIALGLLVIFGIPSPLLKLQRMASEQLPKWRVPQDDFVDAARWVRANSPESEFVIAPPWRKDVFYEMRRPIVAGWHAPRFDKMAEWRKRIESLVGDPSQMKSDDNLTGEMDARARDFYARLSEADLRKINANYNDSGDALLITPTTYSFPELHRSGGYIVYRLPR